MPVSWHLGVVNLPRNRLERLWKRRALHLVIFLLVESLTERHKHSLKIKATKINSNQPCVKTLMQNMQADLLFIWQKAVIRRSRLGWDLCLLRCLFFRIPNKPWVIYSDWVIMQFLISCFCTVQFLWIANAGSEYNWECLLHPPVLKKHRNSFRRKFEE